MKRTAFVVMGVILGLGFLTNSAIAADKFGYVDLSRSFSEYTKTKDYDKSLETKQTSLESERDKLVNDIKKFEEKTKLLSDKEKESKQGEFETKIKGLQDFDRQKTSDLRKEQDEKMKEILKDIEDTVKEYSEKEGFTMVFNDRVLVYQAKNMDITDKIIEMLNKNYKK